VAIKMKRVDAATAIHGKKRGFKAGTSYRH